MNKTRMNDRTTPYGMWRYGNDFRIAAVIVIAELNEKYFMPYYFLIGQSIELLLKAYLMGRGVTILELKNKFGHNLKKLLRESQKQELHNIVNLQQKHHSVIHLLNMEYLDRRFQYMQSGTMYLPEIQFVQEAADMLSDGLEPFCREATKDAIASNK